MSVSCLTALVNKNDNANINMTSNNTMRIRIKQKNRIKILLIIMIIVVLIVMKTMRTMMIASCCRGGPTLVAARRELSVPCLRSSGCRVVGADFVKALGV